MFYVSLGGGVDFFHVITAPPPHVSIIKLLPKDILVNHVLVLSNFLVNNKYV